MLGVVARAKVGEHQTPLRAIVGPFALDQSTFVVAGLGMIISTPTTPTDVDRIGILIQTA